MDAPPVVVVTRTIVEDLDASGVNGHCMRLVKGRSELIYRNDLRNGYVVRFNRS
jgi:hypothetical protein